MSSLPGYPVFKARDDFTIFIERLHNAFAVNRTPQADRVAVLLNQIDEHVYKALRNLCDPDSPTSKTFDELHTLLRRQYVRETSAWKERRQFFNAQQTRTESVNEWYLRLKTLAANCDFGKDLPEMLKNKFVCGLNQPAIAQRIAEEDCNVTMETVLQLAITKEAVLPTFTKQQQQSMKVAEARPVTMQHQPLNMRPETVLRVAIKKESVMPVEQNPVEPKQNPEQNATWKKPVRNRSRSRQRNAQKQEKKVCYHCGLTDHDFSKCAENKNAECLIM